jgi:hypothetical protein
MITVMEIIKLNSIFEVHRSRFSTAISFDVTEGLRKINISARMKPGPQGWFRKESHPERAKDK